MDFEELDKSPEEQKAPSRRTINVERIIRNNALCRFLKILYTNRCQICGFTFKLPNGRGYSESHHIKPLGKPHYGIDKETNLVILCPQHYAMFDFGVIGIEPVKFALLHIDRNNHEFGKKLKLSNDKLAREFLEYHLLTFLTS